MYPYIKISPIIEVTFFRLMTDTTIEDSDYELYSGEFDISIPEIKFEPQLHSSNSESGENGANIIYEVTRKVDDNYEAIPEKFAFFYEDLLTLRVNCESTSYLGYNVIRVNFYGQDYLRNETFSTEFGISIFPKIQEGFGFAIRP